MYNKSLFINDNKIDTVCVMRTAKNVRVGENVQIKFIKIIII